MKTPKKSPTKSCGEGVEIFEPGAPGIYQPRFPSSKTIRRSRDTTVFLAFIGYLSLFFLVSVHADDKRVRASGGETSALAPSSESRIIAYQVGAFLDKKNAELLVEKLGEREFVADIHEQKVGGRMLWAVTVAVSGSPFENLHQELLDAGYESFPIRGPSPQI